VEPEPQKKVSGIETERFFQFGPLLMSARPQLNAKDAIIYTSFLSIPFYLEVEIKNFTKKLKIKINFFSIKLFGSNPNSKWLIEYVKISSVVDVILVIFLPICVVTITNFLLIWTLREKFVLRGNISKYRR
jgi:hypothetical protein